MQKFFESGERIDVTKRQYIEVAVDKIHSIQAGYIGLFVGSGKNTRLLVIMQPGTVFPLDTSLAYGSAFWGLEIYYRALTNATIYALPQSVYDRASRATSALKGQQLDVAIRAQSLLVERIVNLFINDVAKRLHLRLILLAEYVGDKKGDTAVLKLPLTHVDMAESIGTTRETINRLMTKMQNDGYISVHKRIITIISVSRLEDDYKHWKVPNKQ